MAFFVSTGRTGTDFFTTLFNEAVGNAWSLHEPWPAFRARAHRLVGSAPTPFDRLYFRIPRIYRHRKRPERWYVETNYHLFAAISLIREVFPGALIVLIVRDGRSVVTSWLNRWRYITNDHIRPHAFPDDPAVLYWQNWTPLQKLSWYWKTVNRYAWEKGVDQVLYFESVFRADGEGLFPLLERFDDIQYDPEAVKGLLQRPVNRNSRAFFPSWSEWPKAWKEQFDEIAGEDMSWWGYY